MPLCLKQNILTERLTSTLTALGQEELLRKNCPHISGFVESNPVKQELSNTEILPLMSEYCLPKGSSYTYRDNR